MRETHNGQSIPAGLTEWRSESLKSITTLMTNGFVGIATPFYVAKGGVPYFMANNVRANELDPKDHTLVSHEFHKRSARSRLRPGDILTVQTGHIGVSCLVPPEWDDSNAHALIISRCDPARADSRFVCQYLNSWFGRRELWRIQTGGGRPHLNTTDMMHVRVLVPPPPVQSVIADVLDCFDQAAIRVRRLAVARRKLKRGLLQQLLTGQRRFPEFRKQPWVERRLGDIVQRVTRTNTGGSMHALTISGTRGFVDQKKYFSKLIAGESIGDSYLIKRGEFAYNRSLMKGYPFGATKRLDEFDEGVVSKLYVIFAISDPGTDSDFLVHLFESGVINRQLCRITNLGSRAHGLLNVVTDDFFNVKLSLPPLDEQRRIAETLNTMDKEIAHLRDLLHALKEQKKGLMQKLLTGQVRVPASMLKEASHA